LVDERSLKLRKEKTGWVEFRDVLTRTASGLVPTGTGYLKRFPPAIIEAVNAYVKSPPRRFLEFDFLTARVVGEGSHLLHQVSIATALCLVLREWPCDKTQLGEVRRAELGRDFQACDRQNGRFRRHLDRLPIANSRTEDLSRKDF
jgi:hypothetical protein